MGQFRDLHLRAEEEANRGPHEESDGGGSEEASEEKHKWLTAQLLAFKGM